MNKTSHCAFMLAQKSTTLFLVVFFAGAGGCSVGTDQSTPLPEQSLSEFQSASRLKEGSGQKSFGHPQVTPDQMPARGVNVPRDVQGKWKAVKILVRNKFDGELTRVRTVELNSSFSPEDSGLKVTVGPFLPNFVMDKTTYTSVGNEELNPAVQLVVEENDKIIYKGWAFKQFPLMYTFEHEVYSLELLASVPADVS
ncbi:MAG: hypothetical protein QF732_02225 [Nitrospinaceae bacterium]|mgnify:CR=1 FL=1|jgi:hypothetical protein|nr:hypothetical protein [Nitrospinaceae bacterium]|tara:strand:- start:274 stop:864 length:591 start_codon:yes stop_codon:yes gene_type:complete